MPWSHLLRTHNSCIVQLPHKMKYLLKTVKLRRRLFIVTFIVFIFFRCCSNGFWLPPNVGIPINITEQLSEPSETTFPNYTSKLDFILNIQPNVSLISNMTGLVVLVNSQASRFENRETIRLTWGKMARDLHLQVFFLLGEMTEPIQTKVVAESTVFNDIIQGQFLDHYHDMIRKVGMGFQWVLRNYLYAKFVLKTDDDMHIDILRILKKLKIGENIETGNSTIICSTRSDTKPQRTPRKKWYISYDEYNRTSFPTFCLGSFAIVTMTLIPKMLEAARQIDYIWLEDVFWFGLVPEKLDGIEFTNWNNRSFYGGNWSVADYVAYKQQSRILYAHIDQPKLRLQLWEWIQNRTPLKVVYAVVIERIQRRKAEKLWNNSKQLFVSDFLKSLKDNEREYRRQYKLRHFGRIS